MVEALIEQGQPHRAEAALQRLQGPGADHSRADSPEVLLRRADMVLKLGHEVHSQHSSCPRLKSVWWRCLAACLWGVYPPCSVTERSPQVIQTTDGAAACCAEF